MKHCVRVWRTWHRMSLYRISEAGLREGRVTVFCPSRDKESTEMLLEYCAGSLDAETVARLEAHMLECSACRELVELQQAVWDALGEWDAAEVSPDFDRKLFPGIEQYERSPWWRYLLHPLTPFSLRPALPLLAACLVLIAALMIRTPAVIDTPPQTRGDKVDIEQVERTLDDLDMLTQFSAVVLPKTSSTGSM